MSSNGCSLGGDEEYVVGGDTASSGTRKEAKPKIDLFKCPSTIRRDYAKSPFNRKKKPLLQYVTARQQSKMNAGGTRVWDFSVCLDDFRGSYMREKSHFLGVACHRVKVCPKLTNEERLEC
jgi:hypothetical protein